MIPEQEWSTWADAYVRTAARQLLAEEQLAELVQQAGLPEGHIMALKGFWLGRCVYPDPGVRPMSDLDVAVRLDDLDLLLDALPRLGYKPLRGRALSGDVDYWRWRARHLVKAHPGLWIRGQMWQLNNVDVHTELWPNEHWPPWTAPRPDLWSNAEVVEMNSAQASIPSAYLGLLHLCYHNCWNGLQGNWRLLADTDIAVLLAKHAGSWQWEELLEQARRYEILPAVYIALASARQSLGVQVPDHVLAAAKPPVSTRALMWLMGHTALPPTRRLALVCRCFIQSPRERLRFLTLGTWHATVLLGHGLAKRVGLVPGARVGSAAAHRQGNAGDRLPHEQ